MQTKRSRSETTVRKSLKSDQTTFEIQTNTSEVNWVCAYQICWCRWTASGCAQMWESAKRLTYFRWTDVVTKHGPVARIATRADGRQMQSAKFGCWQYQPCLHFSAYGKTHWSVKRNVKESSSVIATIVTVNQFIGYILVSRSSTVSLHHKLLSSGCNSTGSREVWPL
jgi:hypothetical protein